MVALHVAVFFGIKRQGGLDQIAISLGIDDCNLVKKMIMDLKKHNCNKIQYNLTNSVQKLDTTSLIEIRYNMLLEKVESTLRLVKKVFDQY